MKLELRQISASETEIVRSEGFVIAAWWTEGRISAPSMISRNCAARKLERPLLRVNPSLDPFHLLLHRLQAPGFLIELQWHAYDEERSTLLQLSEQIDERVPHGLALRPPEQLCRDEELLAHSRNARVGITFAFYAGDWEYSSTGSCDGEPVVHSVLCVSGGRSKRR